MWVELSGFSLRKLEANSRWTPVTVNAQILQYTSTPSLVPKGSMTWPSGPHSNQTSWVAAWLALGLWRPIHWWNLSESDCMIFSKSKRFLTAKILRTSDSGLGNKIKRHQVYEKELEVWANLWFSSSSWSVGRENGLKGPVQNTGTGEMALAVPADNLGLVLSTTMTCNSSST